jgi:outer membrane protein assembly factor BamB
MVWTMEAKDDIQAKFFIEDGKYFIVRAAEYLHFFDGENGKEIWNTEIPDFEIEGLKLLWNQKKYLVSTTNEEILCYDVYTGKILWKQKYVDIDQSDYRDYENKEAGFIIYYGNTGVCIDPETGRELWRNRIVYDGNRAEKNLPTIFWTWGDIGKRFLFATEDGLLLLDAVTGKTLWKKEEDGELTDREDVEAVTFYGSKALIMYDNDMIGFVDVQDGKELWTRPQDIGDIEGYLALKNLGGTDYLLISLDDTQLMVNVSTGQLAWETKPGELEGVLTHYDTMGDGKNVLCTFMRRHVGGAESGTHMDLAFIDAATGKVHWREKIAYSTYAPATGVANFLSNLLIGEKVLGEHDYGYVFSNFDLGDDRVYLIRGTKGASGMENPLTRDGDGEGLVRINLKTGQVKYRSYFPLNSVGFRWSEVNYKIEDAPEPVVVGDNIYVVGAERIVCANLETGTIVWKIDDDFGFPVDWYFRDNTIFLKVGKQAFSTFVDPKSGDMSAAKAWNKDPYRIYAIDPATGKIFWQIEFDNDPGLGMQIVFDEKTGTLFGADEEELFAVKLSRDAGGKKLWTLKFDDECKIGALDHEECYAVTRSVSSSSTMSGLTTTTTTTYTATAELVLRPVFRGDHFVVFGPDGVCSVDLGGKVQWTTEWDWAGKKVTLVPTFLKNGTIAFMVKENIQVMDEKTGKILWAQEDDEDAQPVIPPNHKYLYMIEDQEVRVYSIGG